MSNIPVANPVVVMTGEVNLAGVEVGNQEILFCIQSEHRWPPLRFEKGKG